jgi:hypothetical protein
MPGERRRFLVVKSVGLIVQSTAYKTPTGRRGSENRLATTEEK